MISFLQGKARSRGWNIAITPYYTENANGCCTGYPSHPLAVPGVIAPLLADPNSKTDNGLTAAYFLFLVFRCDTCNPSISPLPHFFRRGDPRRPTGEAQGHLPRYRVGYYTRESRPTYFMGGRGPFARLGVMLRLLRFLAPEIRQSTKWRNNCRVSDMMSSRRDGRKVGEIPCGCGIGETSTRFRITSASAPAGLGKFQDRAALGVTPHLPNPAPWIAVRRSGLGGPYQRRKDVRERRPATVVWMSLPRGSVAGRCRH